MILIVGLGNPGDAYAATRHNVGREIAAAFAAAHDFETPRFEKKWTARVAEGRIGAQKIVVLLPDTMMNTSGAAIAPAARFYKIKPKDVFVVHDDADIALGSAKLSYGRGSAGHKGAESVIRGLKTRDFWRFRIGIAQKKSAGRRIPAEKLVLKKFTPDEQRAVKKVAARTLAALATAASEGPERAMNTYNS